MTCSFPGVFAIVVNVLIDIARSADEISRYTYQALRENDRKQAGGMS